MKLQNPDAWYRWERANTDPYGKACVDTARRVMEILDAGESFECHELICRADREVSAGGLTGYMAGAVAKMISECHVRGEEFRRRWNYENQIGTEGDRANETEGAVLNPAILHVRAREH